MDKRQLVTLPTAIIVDHTPTTVWRGKPVTSLAKRQRKYTEVHVVTFSSPHVVSVHTRPHKTTTQNYFNRDPSTYFYDYVPAYDTTITTWSFDHLETTSKLWNVKVTLWTTSVHSSFDHFACKYYTTTQSDPHDGTKTWTNCRRTTWLDTSTEWVPYTTKWTLSAAAPTEHSTLLSRLANIAFSGSEWERVRYTQTDSHETAVEVYASNSISGSWTETRTWTQPYATKTWISYHPNFVCDISFHLSTSTDSSLYRSLPMQARNPHISPP
jgi:hypothetical protein